MSGKGRRFYHGKGDRSVGEAITLIDFLFLAFVFLRLDRCTEGDGRNVA